MKRRSWYMFTNSILKNEIRKFVFVWGFSSLCDENMQFSIIELYWEKRLVVQHSSHHRLLKITSTSALQYAYINVIPYSSDILRVYMYIHRK